MNVVIDSKNIDVKIVRKNNKNLYIRAYDSNTLVVTCNNFISENEILKVINENTSSLKKMLFQKENEEEKNEYFYYLGKPYIKEFNENKKDITFNSTTIFAKDEKALTKFYKSECSRVFQNEVDRIIPYFANIPEFSLKIRNMKTRWGVNNRSNNTITLNSELLKKDLDLIDYVIIHELCHFYEANHSSEFWRHVEEYYPHYKEARRRLKE